MTAFIVRQPSYTLRSRALTYGAIVDVPHGIVSVGISQGRWWYFALPGVQTRAYRLRCLRAGDELSSSFMLLGFAEPKEPSSMMDMNVWVLERVA